MSPYGPSGEGAPGYDVAAAGSQERVNNQDQAEAGEQPAEAREKTAEEIGRERLARAGERIKGVVSAPFKAVGKASRFLGRLGITGLAHVAAAPEHAGAAYKYTSEKVRAGAEACGQRMSAAAERFNSTVDNVTYGALDAMNRAMDAPAQLRANLEARLHVFKLQREQSRLDKQERAAQDEGAKAESVVMAAEKRIREIRERREGIGKALAALNAEKARRGGEATTAAAAA